jgi:hypothetical protein
MTRFRNATAARTAVAKAATDKPTLFETVLLLGLVAAVAIACSAEVIAPTAHRLF